MVSELDCAGLSVIQEKTPDVALHELEDLQMPEWRRKTFKHFTEDRIQDDVLTLCHLLARYGDLDLLVDHFLERFMGSSLHRKQAAFILNELLAGCVGRDDSEISIAERSKAELISLVRSVVDEYLQSEYWDLPTSNQSEATLQSSRKKASDWQIVPANHSLGLFQGLTVEQINSNILQICLLLEGLAKGAQLLGTDFEPLLMDVLYPVLEKLGDDNATVSHTAYTALWHIAQACQYSGIEELLKKNSDYLVNSVSLRLRHLSCHPRAPVVLRVAVSYSGKDILPLIEDTITEVMESLDRHYGDQAVLFLRVLFALVQSISKWFPSDPKPTKTSEPESELNLTDELQKLKVSKEETREKQTLDDIGAYFMDYVKQKKIAETLDVPDEDMNVGDPEEAPEEAPEEDFDPDNKTPPPKHVIIVREIMMRCVHLLACPQPRLRLLVLDTVAQSCKVLQSHQDELLPLIHKLWPPFIQRLADEEQTVIIRTFHVLKVLGETSGDFIRQRVVKDVMPKLITLLEKHANASIKAGPAYKYSVCCRLQLSILECIGLLCTHVGLAEHQLVPLLEASLPYLSSRQHSVLQEAAVRGWLQFAEKEPDCVWLMLNKVYCPAPPQPPHESFKPVQLGNNQRNEYSDNIMKILEFV